ncbi:glycoside hydrolase family 6 protein [Shewanella violacea]|uniref:Glucanase n=1 Tax=Shewanella violacea (strain JCM 10179 / CIP 106290 / LMG 19151 / DSS12) TaxID=637905 RepID=D4ZGP3_SHEVD|nr:glycoside hydrolase family 6 protein [Shewanella violacea]BAJ00842.1 cellulose 1,4-beta-cellobiosidase, putative [Shewanella violacea DSS12]
MKRTKLSQAMRGLSVGIGLMGLNMASGYAAVCEYSIDNEWNTGFVAKVSITNDGPDDIQAWQLTWDYAGANRISSSWNVSLTGNNPYSAAGSGWNNNVPAGGNVEFGFQGTKNGEDAEIPLLQGDICTPANSAPLAVATADLTQGEAPLIVTLDATQSTDADNDYNELTFSWSFSDGTSATGDMVSHSFTSVGSHSATVTVSDGNSSSSKTIAIEVLGNHAPVATATVSTPSGKAPLATTFDATASSDVDNDDLTYEWDFGDGTTSSLASPEHTFVANGDYQVNLTVSDGELSDTTVLSIHVGDEILHVENPFSGVSHYVDSVWAAKAAAEPGGEAIANVSTAVWMDRIGAITDGIGLRGHLDEALAQNAGMFMFVVYDLPNRDCAALASNGELRISENGMQRYKEEYIGPIVDIISDPKYASLRIVTIIEVDSLPNLVTNLGIADCAEADGPDGYRDGIRHTLNELGGIPNVYTYLDIAHSGWLGWSSNFGTAIDLVADVITSTDGGWDNLDGFISNSANYTPVVEPYLPDPQLSVGGMPIRSADFFEWNDYFEEKSYVQDWREAMIALGAPESLGMLIDTSRNGWGGAARPTEVSQADDIDVYVDASRVDRRFHRGNWCNQAGGVGFKPWADPYVGIDAFVWVKPPGESDGISDPNFTPDPNDPAKRHDGMCDPEANSHYNAAYKTGSMANAPHAGRWFPEQFAVLLANAYPDVKDPAGPPPPPPPPRDDCPGLDASNPLVISEMGTRNLVDLGCEAPIHVLFSQPIPRNLYVENTDGPFNVELTYDGTTTPVSGHFKSLGLVGVEKVTLMRIDGATTLELRFD